MHGAEPSHHGTFKYGTLSLFFFPLKCSIQFSGDGLSVAVHEGRGSSSFLQGSQLHSFKCLFLPSGAMRRAAALHLASAKCNLSEPEEEKEEEEGRGGGVVVVVGGGIK